MKKRMIGFMMAVCLIVGLFPAITPNAQAASSGTCGKQLTWTLDDEGTLTISGTGKMSNYSYAGGPWKNEMSLVKKVVVQDGVTSIGSYAFDGCESLSSIAIPDSVTGIGKWAFAGCKSLNNVTVPNSVTSIGDYAFVECLKLTSVTIGNGVTSIGSYAFDWCVSLHTITVAADNKTYRSQNGILFNKQKTTLIRCPQATTITTYKIPDSVTSIGAAAFESCNKLISVTIPSNVRSIGSEAFASCTRLSVTMKGNAPSAAAEIFYDCSPIIYIPKGATGYNKSPWTDCTVKEIGATAVSLSSCTASLSYGKCAYNGSERKPSVTVKNGSKTLKSGTDYTVSYKNNKNIGTATVTITGKGNYSGTLTKTFVINPKATSFSSAYNVSGKKLKATWKKVSGVTGYQLQYSTSSKFASVATKTLLGTTKTLTGLSKNKTYYVRVRAYKTVSKKSYYSAWSASKKVKIQK